MGGEIDVGVLENDHRVLAAEFQADRCQPARGAFHHLAPGGAGTGELQVVDVVDDGLGYRAGTLGQLEHRGSAGFLPAAPQRLGGQRGALRRLQQHGAAGGQGTEPIHQGVGHRVVPRRDDAHDRPRPVVHGDLLDRHERQCGRPLFGCQRLFRRLDVVRDDHDQHRHFLCRVGRGFTGLLDQQLFDLAAVLTQPYREAGQHLGAPRRAALLPFALCGAQPGDDGGHVSRVGPLHLARDRAVRGAVNGAGAGKLGGAGRGFGRLDGGHRGHRRRVTVTQVAHPRQVSSLPS